MRQGFIFDPVARKSVWVDVQRGELRQPSYSRGPTTRATSSKLLAFRSCVQAEMSGKGGSRQEVRDRLSQAAKTCAHGGKNA